MLDLFQNLVWGMSQSFLLIWHVVKWGIKKMTNTKLDHTNDIDNSSINFETDSIRFIFDSHLTEYDGIRREIEFRMQSQEQTFNYLILLIVGLFALSELISGKIASKDETLSLIRSFFESDPYFYLILAILLMFFPLNYIYHNILIVILGGYQYEVLTEKIDAIAEKLSNYSEATLDYLKWESSHYEGKPLKGTFKWDDYRLSNQIGSTATLIFFSPIALFRPLILLIPPILLFLVFADVRSLRDFRTWGTPDYISLFLFLISLIVFVFGLIYTAMAHRKGRNMAKNKL